MTEQDLRRAIYTFEPFSKDIFLHTNEAVNNVKQLLKQNVNVSYENVESAYHIKRQSHGKSSEIYELLKKAHLFNKN